MDKVFKSGITNLRKTLTRQQTAGDKKDEKNGMLFGIQTSHLLPDEIANKEMTEAQKRRATRVFRLFFKSPSSLSLFKLGRLRPDGPGQRSLGQTARPQETRGGL